MLRRSVRKEDCCGCWWLSLRLPVLWILQMEFTYERNMRHGIPADFRDYEPHEVVMWKV